MKKVRVKMDMHNTYVECDEDAVTLPKYVNAVVDWRTRPLIDKLSLKRPAWHFVSSSYGNNMSNGTTSYQRFKVEDCGEELGYVDVESDWRDNKNYTYIFDCARLSRKRSRGQYTKTKNVDKAVKTILDNMFGLTLKERMLTVTAESRGIVSSIINDASFRYHNRVRILTPFLTGFATSRWEEFVASIPAEKDKSMAMELPPMIERNTTMQGVSRAQNAKHGAVVMEYNGRYYVQLDASPDDTHDYTLDTLPTGLKSNISLLKLVDKGTAIDGVGVRTTDTAFYVFI